MVTTTLNKSRNITQSPDYQKNGFLLIQNFLNTVKINCLEEQIMTAFQVDNFSALSDKICHLNKTDQGRLFEFNKLIGKNPLVTSCGAQLLELINNDPKELCAIHLGGGILLGLPQDDRLTYSWHQECNYIPGFKYLYNAWIPLFNKSTKSNGTMSFLCGTHQRGKLNYTVVQKSNGYCDLITDVKDIDVPSLEYHCYANPGDAFIFDQNLIHRSNYNAGDTVRFSITVRLGFVNDYAKVDDWKRFY